MTLQLGESMAPSKLPKGWRWLRLGDICVQDRRAVQPNTDPARNLPYLSLEHVESQSGRILPRPGETPKDIGTSTTFAFDERHVLYGKLRPYLNKVAVPTLAGRCTTEIIPLLPTGVDRGFLAWLLRHPQMVEIAMRDKTGARMPRANMDDLLTTGIPVPSFDDQRRIAATLTNQMATVDLARAAAEAQVAAAGALPSAYLRAIFTRKEAQEWPSKRLAESGHLLPAKSIATAGDSEVIAVTTACLSEGGFRPAGTKRARMWAHDVSESLLRPGEVLIARSNTTELVGRAAVFAGDPPGAVASDLTIRYLPNDGIQSEFLGAFLSYLYLTGYWKERAGGASGSMKKITRGQVLELHVPVPATKEQRGVVACLTKQRSEAALVLKALEDRVAAISALPAILLGRAFSGGM